MKVAVIGAGASGLFVSGLIDKNIEVHLYEKNNMLGKKLLITGSGRCNVTNLKEPHLFLENVFEGKKFFLSAINNFTPFEMKELLRKNGVFLTVEENDKAFPKEEKAEVILSFLKNQLAKNVKIFYQGPVTSIEEKNGKFEVQANNTKNIYEAVIIATGGKSHQLTGSNGEGYEFAKQFGHTVTNLRPSLCGIVCNEEIFKSNMGVSVFANVKIVDENQKILSDDTGDIMFTHFGVSGPAVHRLSAKFAGEKVGGHFLKINFFPSLSAEEFKNRVDEFCSKSPQQEMFKLFEGQVVKRLLNWLKEKHPNLMLVKAGQISKKDRQCLTEILTKHSVKIADFDSFDRAIVTRGGVSEKEINPKTFESKIVKNLYFIGEVLNVDGLTGGFNLQIAFSSAFAAAKAINEKFL